MAKDQVKEVKDRIDIVTLVGTYVPLKKAGRHYKAPCPFHDEKTPSFVVSPDLQLYKCFGCGKAGDVFNFLQEMEGMSFAESLQSLAQQAGVKLTRRAPSPQEKLRKRIVKANSLAADVFHYLLTEHESGKRARDYLERRGLTKETIEKYKIGYSPMSWDFLGNYLTKKGYSTDEQVAAGLALKKTTGRGFYDRFRGRLMFPLIDAQEHVIGFNARALESEDQPKYMNSPETKVFTKSSFLFGFATARRAIKKENSVIVVEGPMDVIGPAQHGFENIVAPMGTALTAAQLNMLSRLTDTVLFCFDGDVAGMGATKRSITLAQQHHFDVKVVLLPEGTDPDDIVREDPSEFKKALEAAVPVVDYYFHAALTTHDVTTARGKKKIGEDLLPIIKVLPNKVERGHYVKRLAEVLDVAESFVVDALSATSGTKKEPTLGDQNLSKSTSSTSLEEYVLSLLLRVPLERGQAAVHRLGKNDFANEISQGLFISLKEYLTGRESSLDIKEFYDLLEGDTEALAQYCYLHDLSLEEHQFEKELEEALQLLKNKGIKRELRALSAKIKAADDASDFELSTQLQQQFQELTSKLL